MENRISEVGKTAIRIGEQLETIDKERSKASESRDIIEYFMEFQEGSSERLDSLVQSGEEGQLKVEKERERDIGKIYSDSGFNRLLSLLED